RTLQQIAHDYGHLYPNAAKVLLQDFYVDDCITGASSVDDALDLQRELVDLLQHGGLSLRKWASSEPTLLHNSDSGQPLFINPDEQIKTLGVLWNPAEDTFSFSVNKPSDGTFTKRSTL